jgi:methylmalonyl-CoA carboxyltransferase large subunit
VQEVLEEIRRELARLGERVAALEARLPATVLTASQQWGSEASEAAPAIAGTGVSDEILVVLSAAVAAFLGKKPRIRQVRLVGSSAWAQQGRVTIQASHALPVHHG